MKRSIIFFTLVLNTPVHVQACCPQFWNCFSHPEQDETPLQPQPYHEKSVSKDDETASGVYVHSTIKSIDEISGELNKANEETLVVFDLDETLLEPIDPTFQFRYKNETDLEYKKRLPVFSFLNQGFFCFKVPRHLVEPQLAPIIQDLQKKQVPIVVLSAFSGGEFEEVKDIHEFRHQELCANNIHLDQPFSLDYEHLQKTFDKQHLGKPIISFKRGIISSSNYPKGFILKLFIQHLHKPPHNILFIDDNPRNFYSFYSHLEDIKTASIRSYLYLAANTKKDYHPKLEQKILQKQFDLMAVKKDYVSYAEAKKTLLLEEKNPEPLWVTDRELPYASV